MRRGGKYTDNNNTRKMERSYEWHNVLGNVREEEIAFDRFGSGRCHGQVNWDFRGWAEYQQSVGQVCGGDQAGRRSGFKPVGL